MPYPWQKRTWKQLLELRSRLPHALLIHGPAGIGKLTLAEEFTQFLLCEATGELRAPCRRCDGCRWFLAGSHPDFRRLEPESLARQRDSAEGDEDRSPAASKGQKPSVEIKIDQVRELDAFLNLRSHRGRRRVVLVHPAEAMNLHAANALLKGLEEPQAEAHFILVSHRPARLLPTLRSRCVALPFAPPTPEEAGPWLRQQAIQEWEQWLAFAGNAPLRALEYATGAGKLVLRFRLALASRDCEALANVVDREELEALAEVLQKHAFDVALASLAGRSRFGTAKGEANAAAWLQYARLMGKNRLLASHPLNPRLFAGEMVAGMPRG
jgi:DNA polymerase-3 subunit delta'